MIVRTNTKIEKNSYSPHLRVVPAIQNGYMASPNIALEVDYSVFEKTAEEKFNAREKKRDHVKSVKTFYGAAYKGQLNVPSKSLPDSVRS